MKYCHFLCKDFNLLGFSKYWDGDIQFLRQLLVRLYSFSAKLNLTKAGDDLDLDFIIGTHDDNSLNDEKLKMILQMDPLRDVPLATKFTGGNIYSNLNEIKNSDFEQGKKDGDFL